MPDHAVYDRVDGRRFLLDIRDRCPAVGRVVGSTGEEADHCVWVTRFCGEQRTDECGAVFCYSHGESPIGRLRILSGLSATFGEAIS